MLDVDLELSSLVVAQPPWEPAEVPFVPRTSIGDGAIQTDPIPWHEDVGHSNPG